MISRMQTSVARRAMAAPMPHARRLAVRVTASSADAKFGDYKPKIAAFFPGQGAQVRRRV